MTGPAPYDEPAEDALVGALLVGFHDAVSATAKVLTPADFYVTANQAAFAAICSLWEQGHRIDPVVVAAETRRMGSPVSFADLNAKVTGATGSWRRTTQIVRDAAARRRLRNALTAADAAVDIPGTAVDVIVAELHDSLTGVGLGSSGPTRDLYTAAELIERTDMEPPPWAIPGLLRVGWRAVLVAFEGRGKSVLLTSMACMAGQGVHPFTHKPIPAVSTLIVDLENPADLLAGRLRDYGGDRGDVHVWHRPQGINLRERSHRAELEANIAASHPTLVCLGPLYKSYARAARESDEQAAVEVQAVLDDLQARYGFALLIEHHAPHADSGSSRKPRPYGSSLWLRWPEFGIGLEDYPDIKGSLTLGRFRGDRVTAGWPDRIDRSKPWPWVGWWANGVPQVEAF